MDTFLTNRIAKAFTTVIFLMASIATNAQVSPYGISPDWYFGQGGRLLFPNGNYPTSGAPTELLSSTNNSVGVEASTSVCFRDGSVAVYSNTMQAYNGASTGGWWTYIRQFNGADNTCAGSSTTGAVCFPDPANSNPAGTNTNDAFYMIMSNDLTAGGCAGQGMNRYRFTGTGTTVAYASGPTNVETNAFASEAAVTAADGTGGYWLITHSKTTANTFRVWHYTTAGTVTGPTDYTFTALTSPSSGQSSIKISPCQNKIAFFGGGPMLLVYNFNRTTGVISTELDRVTVGLSPDPVGLEFSTDGNRIFFSGQGTVVKYFTIGSSGTIGTVAGSSSWTMQMGPDGKIYTSGVGSTTHGVISNTSGTPTHSALTVAAGASIYRGLVNMSWLNPQNRAITHSGACSVTFGIDFKNYFNSQVAINASTIQWDFNGDGTWETAFNGQTAPVYDYAANGGSGTYTVNVRFNDQNCGQQWTATTTVTAVCPMPVDWLSVSADIVTDGVDISWATSSEINTSYFVVQRSQDGREFSDIGTTPAAGNSNIVSEYSLRDLNPYAGASYYRIKQYDIDGKSTSSRIVAVNMSTVNLNVFPNPSEGQFELELSGAGSAQLTVTDVLGRVVYSNSLQGDYVNARFGEDLGKGTYVLTVVTPTKTLHEKLVKE